MNFSIYISGEPDDDTIAITLKKLLQRTFQNSEISMSSRDPIGSRALMRETRDKLRHSTVIIGLLSPYSMRSSCVLFEVGAGFIHNKSLLLCADAVSPRDLMPPLQYLPARTLTPEGVRSLFQDVARVAEISFTNQDRGIDSALMQINSFLLLRNEAEERERDRQSGLASGIGLRSDLTPVILEPDPDIESSLEKLETTLLKAIAAVCRVGGHGDSGSPLQNSLAGPNLERLIDHARAENIPFPENEIRMYQYIKVDGSEANRSAWGKMNAMNRIEDTLDTLARFLRAVSRDSGD